MFPSKAWLLLAEHELCIITNFCEYFSCSFIQVYIRWVKTESETSALTDMQLRDIHNLWCKRVWSDTCTIYTWYIHTSHYQSIIIRSFRSYLKTTNWIYAPLLEARSPCHGLFVVITSDKGAKYGFFYWHWFATILAQALGLNVI